MSGNTAHSTLQRFFPLFLGTWIGERILAGWNVESRKTWLKLSFVLGAVSSGVRRIGIFTFGCFQKHSEIHFWMHAMRASGSVNPGPWLHVGRAKHTSDTGNSPAPYAIIITMPDTGLEECPHIIPNMTKFDDLSNEIVNKILSYPILEYLQSLTKYQLNRRRPGALYIPSKILYLRTSQRVQSAIYKPGP